MSAAVIIIGSGLAGYMTAKAFRKLDQQTPLIVITEQDGRFYSKPQLSTGLTHKKMVDDLALYSAEQMAEQLSATVMTNTAVASIDAGAKQVVLSNGERIEYRDCVLATGADVLHAPLAGDAVSDVISVNHLQHYERFRTAIADAKHVAIFGAGLVGCEFANDLLNAGHQVSIIAPDHYPLQRFLPAEMGQCMQQALAEQGVTWYLEQFATDINRTSEGQYALTLCNQEQTVVADVVLSAVGFRPSETLARTAGVACDKGVLVDRGFRTNVAHIYALGDCAVIEGQWLPFVAPINHGCKVLAENLAGGNAEVDYPVMPVTTKTPLCPLVMVPPSESVEGQWHIVGDCPNRTARFEDAAGQLHGFALMGNTLKLRMEWINQMNSCVGL